MSKDTIYRQAAIDAIFSEPLYNSGMKKRDVDVVVPAIYEKIKSLSSVQPERIKDIIQKFHDYQVEWLISHNDLELEPQLEEWVVRFLHDTANCFVMEIDTERRTDV